MNLDRLSFCPVGIAFRSFFFFVSNIFFFFPRVDTVSSPHFTSDQTYRKYFRSIDWHISSSFIANKVNASFRTSRTKAGESTTSLSMRLWNHLHHPWVFTRLPFSSVRHPVCEDLYSPSLMSLSHPPNNNSWSVVSALSAFSPGETTRLESFDGVSPWFQRGHVSTLTPTALLFFFFCCGLQNSTQMIAEMKKDCVGFHQQRKDRNGYLC